MTITSRPLHWKERRGGSLVFSAERRSLVGPHLVPLVQWVTIRLTSSPHTWEERTWVQANIQPSFSMERDTWWPLVVQLRDIGLLVSPSFPLLVVLEPTECEGREHVTVFFFYGRGIISRVVVYVLCK